jgi:cytochrome c oxidase subunit 2
VPVDTAVVLHLDSTDLIHRWSIPALGGAFDAVPGSENQTWFRADETGTYEGRSTAFSGPGYNAMRAKVTVLEPTEYEAWLTEQASAIRSAQDSVQEAVDEGTAPGVSVGEDTSEPLPEEGGGE